MVSYYDKQSHQTLNELRTTFPNSRYIYISIFVECIETLYPASYIAHHHTSTCLVYWNVLKREVMFSSATMSPADYKKLHMCKWD